MKHLMYFVLAFLALAWSSQTMAQAQDCKHIVLPHCGYSENQYDNMPMGKIVWYCAYSHNSFFVADQLPAGVSPLSISVVQNKRTGDYLPANFQVNLDSLSFYAYNFDQFQSLDGPEVYFSTPQSAHPYLVLRNYYQVMNLVKDIDIYAYDDDDNNQRK